MRRNLKVSVYIILILHLSIVSFAGCTISASDPNGSEDKIGSVSMPSAESEVKTTDSVSEGNSDNTNTPEPTKKPGLFESDSSIAGNRVFDEAGLLTDKEIADFAERITEITKEYQMDIVVVTILDAEGKTSMEYADDYYDNNGFGYGKDKSGILLLINMEDRELWISTTGKAINCFSDETIKIMVDFIAQNLSLEEYQTGIDAFLDFIKTYFYQGSF